MNRAVLLAGLLAWGWAGAESPEGPPASPTAPSGEMVELEIRGHRLPNPLARDRAVQRVTATEINQRQARSTPDALRYVPGTFVQQTGHGQGSPYIRGRTGQQVLLLFDGLRINNALFRQGPNQYLFTVDSRTVETLDVVRGSASVTLGADAIAGAVMVTPRSPGIDPTLPEGAIRSTSRFSARYATADEDTGGRAEAELQYGPRLGFLVGAGYRDVGRLESSGSVGHLLSQDQVNVPLFEKEVPTFAADGRTQLGTGFSEATGDARMVWDLHPRARLTAAGYVYRQGDAPRTDQCPPPEADLSECLVFRDQDRTQSYLRLDASPGWLGLNALELMGGWVRQFERRERDSSETLGAITGGEDLVDMYNARLVGHTRPLRRGPAVMDLDYGVDGSTEAVQSSAYITLVRVGVTRQSSRGQYIAGSTYQRAAGWLSPRVDLWDRLTLRAGGRLAYAAAEAAADEDTASIAVDQSWTATVFNAGAEVRPLKGLALKLNVEQGFRPPNLDDMTGRQPTGRGYQLENADLQPEQATTYEVGLQYDHRRVQAALWAFDQRLVNAMERRSAACPAGDRECRAARAAVQLVNLKGEAQIRGIEASLKVRPGLGLSLLGTLAITHGEGDSPVEERPGRVSLSRIPPVNGVGELMWRDPGTGLYAGGAVRWALDQTDLSFGDEADARIPFGGTPGYVVFDARLGLRTDAFSVYAVLENLTDEPNRNHGSAVNGPGRGIIVNVEVVP
ncbi:MAG: TonB-dependent receptor [Myxococcales bacterium]|nr:TonB-dependent receptor [Myxococcales bacterium]